MCLYKRSVLPRIATKDMEVYKIVHKVMPGMYKTLYTEYTFKVGDESKCSESFSKGLFKSEIGAEGVHSYVTLNDALLKTAFVPPYMNDVVVIKCIIPKGTLYYQGYNNEIASKKLIYGEEINQKEVFYNFFN